MSRRPSEQSRFQGREHGGHQTGSRESECPVLEPRRAWRGSARVYRDQIAKFGAAELEQRRIARAKLTNRDRDHSHDRERER